MIYFTIKKLNEHKAFLAMLCFLLAFGCKNKSKGQYTLSITKPTNGTLSSDAGSVNCGSKTDACKASFNKGAEVTLIAAVDTGYAPAAWQGACDKTEADQACKLSMDANKTTGKVFHLDIDTDGDGIIDALDDDDDNDKILDETDVDDNGNGLIEIHNLDMFDHIRHDLAGTSYKTGADAEDDRTGAPEAETDDCTTAIVDGSKSFYLCGYELMRDLDFSDEKSYAAGSTKKNDWQPNKADPDSATNAGFVGATDFAGLFDGNGYKISNLYSRHTAGSASNIGLFVTATATATIRNVGVVAARLHGGAGNNDYVGGLVGDNEGSIRASYATGAVHGGAGGDAVGGLVGNNGGSITASYAMGKVNSGGDTNRIGGLVGNNGGSITASYAGKKT